MSKSRITYMAVGAGLILATLVVLTAVGLSAGAKERHDFYAGMGELKRFDDSQSLQESEAEESSKPYTGMADWRRFEVQQSMQSNREQPTAPYTGMADWRRFEVQQSINNSGVRGTDHLSIGMGDLHRFESR